MKSNIFVSWSTCMEVPPYQYYIVACCNPMFCCGSSCMDHCNTLHISVGFIQVFPNKWMSANYVHMYASKCLHVTYKLLYAYIWAKYWHAYATAKEYMQIKSFCTHATCYNWVVKLTEMSHLANCTFLAQLIATLIHYPCTVAIPGLAAWSAFLEQILPTMWSHDWDNGTHGGH